jgi:Tfp pilus assembly protein PilN
MSVSTLNLATRPFRNERLPALLLALGFTIAGGVTIKHVAAIRGLMPGRTSGLARQVVELEEERGRLRAQSGRLRAPQPPQTAVAQWALLKDLVDRRTFSWSGLFAVLEETLPKGVRLLSIAPAIEKGQMKLELSAVARSNEDALELIRALEDRPEFDDVVPRARTGELDGQLGFRITMRYTPQDRPAVAATAATPGATPAPSAPPPASPSPAAAVATPGPSRPPARSPSPTPLPGGFQ